jgi:hypothetical protein
VLLREVLPKPRGVWVIDKKVLAATQMMMALQK